MPSCGIFGHYVPPNLLLVRWELNIWKLVSQSHSERSALTITPHSISKGDFKPLHAPMSIIKINFSRVNFIILVLVHHHLLYNLPRWLSPRGFPIK
jgi:hypothetical protein